MSNENKFPLKKKAIPIGVSPCPDTRERDKRDIAYRGASVESHHGTQVAGPLTSSRLSGVFNSILRSRLAGGGGVSLVSVRAVGSVRWADEILHLSV
jgi:hypothetical protein